MSVTQYRWGVSPHFLFPSPLFTHQSPYYCLPSSSVFLTSFPLPASPLENYGSFAWCWFSGLAQLHYRDPTKTWTPHFLLILFLPLAVPISSPFPTSFAPTKQPIFSAIIVYLIYTASFTTVRTLCGLLHSPMGFDSFPLAGRWLPCHLLSLLIPSTCLPSTFSSTWLAP